MKLEVLNLLPVPLPWQLGSPSHCLVPHHREVGTAGKVLRDGNRRVEIENYVPPATCKHNTSDHFWLRSRKHAWEQTRIFSHRKLDLISWTQVSLPQDLLSSVLFQNSFQSSAGSYYRRLHNALSKLSNSWTVLKIWLDSNTLAADSVFNSKSHCNPDSTETLSVKLGNTFHAELVRFLWSQTNLSFKNRCKTVSPHRIKIGSDVLTTHL